MLTWTQTTLNHTELIQGFKNIGLYIFIYVYMTAECDGRVGEQWRGVRLVEEKAMEGLWTVFLWFRVDLLQHAFVIDADLLSPHQCIQIKQC